MKREDSTIGLIIVSKYSLIGLKRRSVLAWVLAKKVVDQKR